MIVSINGNVRSGKTLLLTILAINAYQAKIPVYSNYPLKIPHEELTLDVIDKILNEEIKIENAFFAGDELYLWLESRGSAVDEVNKFFSYFVMQSGKRQIELAYTAQLSGMVDLRLRELANYLIVCEKKKDGFYYYLTDHLKVRTFFLSFNHAKRFYDKYDTWKIQDIREKEKFIVEKSTNELKECYQLMKDDSTLKDLTRDEFRAIIRRKIPSLNYEDTRLLYKMINDQDKAESILSSL